MLSTNSRVDPRIVSKRRRVIGIVVLMSILVGYAVLLLVGYVPFPWEVIGDEVSPVGVHGPSGSKPVVDVAEGLDSPSSYDDIASLVLTLFDDVVRVPAENYQQRVRTQYGPLFRVLETDHLRVISDTSFRYHQVVSGQLELFYQEVHKRFFVEPMKPVTFYLINGGEDYEHFMENHGHGEHKDGYGMYSSEDRCLYARRYFRDGSQSGVGTLFHEMIHAMVDADFPERREAPVWFNEGFACLFEHGRILKGRWVYGNPNPWRETPFRQDFGAGRLPTLKQYFMLAPSQYYAEGKSKLYYNSGRSLCLYLLRSHGETVLAKFVDLVRRGHSGREAVEGATGMKIAEIEKAWHQSIQAINFGGDYIHRSEKMNLKDKLRCLEEGVKRHPDYGLMRYKLSVAYYQAEKYADAIKEAQSALLDPRLPFPSFAWRYIGSSKLKLSEEAQEPLQQALSFQPWYENVLSYELRVLGLIHQQKGDIPEARKLKALLARLNTLDAIDSKEKD